MRIARGRPGEAIGELWAILTQAETGRRLGKGQAYVWNSEVGEHRVDAVKLKELDRVHGIATTFFYE